MTTPGDTAVDAARTAAAARRRREWLRALTQEQYGRPVAEWAAVRQGRRPDPTEWEAGLLRRAELLRAVAGLPDDYDERPDLFAERARSEVESRGAK